MHPGLSHSRGRCNPQRNRGPDPLYSCFKKYFFICFSFPLDQQGKNVNQNSWGKLNPSHTSVLLLTVFNEGVQWSAVIKGGAGGWIRMVSGHCVNTKIQREQLTIRSVP